jgi:hypothetical protein
MGIKVTYKIVRNYFNWPERRTTIETDLTLEEARAHCADPETSSSTCKHGENLRRTENRGPWFDSYTEER